MRKALILIHRIAWALTSWTGTRMTSAEHNSLQPQLEG